MESKLSDAQLAQVVAEVERLNQRREAELDREQVRQILSELNLPPDLLEEALVQVQRREALVARKKQQKQITLGITAFVVVAIATTVFFWQARQQAYSRVTSNQARITLASDRGGSNLGSVNRNLNAEVYYRVTLQDAPLGQQLDLTCSWLDPMGKIVKQNHYQTRPVDKSVWETYCRYQIGGTAPTGNWTVQMLLGDRVLSSTIFTVQ